MNYHHCYRAHQESGFSAEGHTGDDDQSQYRGTNSHEGILDRLEFLEFSNDVG